MNPPDRFRVLVADDTPYIHADFRKVLERPESNSPALDLARAVLGAEAEPRPPGPAFDLAFATQGQEALALVEAALAARQPFALAFVDMRMPPGWDGLETIEKLWACDPDLQVVICTAHSDHSWAAINQRLGPSDRLLILKKPFDQVEAMQLAHTLCRKWALTRLQRDRLAALGQMVDERTSRLKAAEQQFMLAFNASPFPQAIVELQPFRLREINTAFQAQVPLRRDQLGAVQPESFGHGLDPRRWRDLNARLARGEPIDEHAFAYQSPAGGAREYRLTARPLEIDGRACAIFHFRDVTKELETEAQLRLSQRMEAVGQLAAGIAHDFNNLLTVISGYTAEYIANRAPREERHRLEPVLTAAEQAASLTRQLLIFSRKDVTRPQRLDLARVFDSLAQFLRRLIGEHIEVAWQVPAGLPPIIADPSNIEQVVVNLAVNARDALPAGGTIIIAAREAAVDAARAAGHAGARPGRFVELAVTDTGTGISPEVLPRIFEAFFTTKESGKGTGLGLSNVASIVSDHRGWVEVETELGRGSTFRVFLPVADVAVLAAAPAERPTVPVGPIRCRRVLVAEDDPMIQTLLGTILERHGVKHDVVRDGVVALETWRARPGEFDLLVSDITMPNGISGLDLARELRRDRPLLPVILISGYSDAHGRDPGEADIPGPPPVYLPKPFLPAELLGLMHRFGGDERAPGADTTPPQT